MCAGGGGGKRRVLRQKGEAYAIEVRSCLREHTGRSVSRGALYATLERLERKGLLTWATEPTSPRRGGVPRRRFVVTEQGLEAIRESQGAIANLSEGLDLALGG